MGAQPFWRVGHKRRLSGLEGRSIISVEVAFVPIGGRARAGKSLQLCVDLVSPKAGVRGGGGNKVGRGLGGSALRKF